MPYFDCTWSPQHHRLSPCLTSQAYSFHTSWRTLVLPAAPGLALLISSMVLSLVGLYLLRTVRDADNEISTRPAFEPRTLKVYRFLTLTTTGLGILLMAAMTGVDIARTSSATPWYRNRSRNLVFQIGWFLDVALGAALLPLLAKLVRRREARTGKRVLPTFDPLELGAEAFLDPRFVLWRLRRTVKLVWKGLVLGAFAFWFSGEVVLRALAAVVLGRLLAGFVEGCWHGGGSKGLDWGVEDQVEEGTAEGLPNPQVS